MTELRVEVHPAAVDEASAARQWYETRNPSAADGFVSELDHALEQILEAPERWPPYLFGTRRFVFHRFPFFVVYRLQGAVVQILAVAHARRRPGYWAER